MSTSVRLDEETKKKLSLVAKYNERTPHWIMVKAIEEYLEKESAHISFLQESIDGLESAKSTGEFSTLNDLIEWSEKLGTDNELELPKSSLNR